MPGEMCRGSLPSDVISFNTAMSACDKAGQRVASMPGEMCRGCLSSDVISFDAAISVREQDGQWQQEPDRHWRRTWPLQKDTCRHAGFIIDVISFRAVIPTAAMRHSIYISSQRFAFMPRSGGGRGPNGSRGMNGLRAWDPGGGDGGLCGGTARGVKVMRDLR
eukprot:3829529-Karenia_brevis.AAC.1